MSDFVARTPDEWAFRQWIAGKCQGGYVEVEKVASGEGIANLYKWLREAHPDLLTNIELDTEIMAASEPAGVIGKHCTVDDPGSDALCIRACLQ